MLTIIRGMPGSGKSTLGRRLAAEQNALFIEPDKSARLLKETLGDPNCRVVVSLKRAMVTSGKRDKLQKVPICLKRIVLHNPQTKTYCVMVWDGNALKLVSWNNADADYGNSEWTLK